MKEELVIKGTRDVQGKEIKIIEGGFGKNQKCILVSDAAKQHDTETRIINELINRNIKRFGENDLIDFLNRSERFRDFAKENGLITSNRIKNIFLLSERGYTKLVAMMDNKNEKKWEVMDRLVDEYFAMREIINSDEQMKSNLLMSIYKGGQESIFAARQLTDIEVKVAKTEIVKKIQPKLDLLDKFTKSNNVYDVGIFSKILSIHGLGRNNLFAWMREKEILRYNNEPYQQYIKYFKVTCNENNGRTTYKTWITGKGIIFLYKKLTKENLLIAKSVEEILEELEQMENKAA